MGFPMKPKGETLTNSYSNSFLSAYFQNKAEWGGFHPIQDLLNIPLARTLMQEMGLCDPSPAESPFNRKGC